MNSSIEQLVYSLVTYCLLLFATYWIQVVLSKRKFIYQNPIKSISFGALIAASSIAQLIRLRKDTVSSSTELIASFSVLFLALLGIQISNLEQANITEINHWIYMGCLIFLIVAYMLYNSSINVVDSVEGQINNVFMNMMFIVVLLIGGNIFTVNNIIFSNLLTIAEFILLINILFKLEEQCKPLRSEHFAKFIRLSWLVGSLYILSAMMFSRLTFIPKGKEMLLIFCATGIACTLFLLIDRAGKSYDVCRQKGMFSRIVFYSIIILTGTRVVLWS